MTLSSRSAIRAAAGLVRRNRRAAAVVAAGAAALLAVTVLTVPGAATSLTAPNASADLAGAPVTVGVHDGAVNGCDENETRTTAPVDYAKAASSLTDQHWAGLHVHTVRFSAPWDIAYHHDANQRANDALVVEQLCLNYWLAEAAHLHAQPEIAFKPDYNYLTGDGRHIRVPDIGAYRAAMDRFTALYSNCTAFGGTAGACALPPVPSGFTPYPAGTGGMARVRIVAPWGEPNFAGGGSSGFAGLPQQFAMPKGRNTFDDPNCHNSFTPDTCGPVLAAQMWLAVDHRCRDNCTVIAGDFSSSGGLETRGAPASYLTTYAAYLKNLTGARHAYRPSVWAVHPYSDVSAIENYDGHVPGARRPGLAGTLVGRFTGALHRLGYGSRTEVWLNEISTFYREGLSSAVHPQWTRTVQADAARYLLTELVRAGGRTAPGEPVVTRLYYLRYQDGPGFPRWALVVGGTPQPAYTVFATRPNPR